MATKASRPYDALFDPTFTVPGARDHAKQQSQIGLVLQRMPEHANMFSELQHMPASTLRVRVDETLPAHVDRSFHPQQHSPQLLRWQSSRAHVSGAQLFRIVHRPLLAPGASASWQLRLAPQQAVPLLPPAAPPEPAAKDAGTQSDFRESEAQTLPWSPGWVLPSNPAVLAKQAALCAKFNSPTAEVLQLAHLTFGNGLPGGLEEVRRLEKLRTKRAFEASLPPLHDVGRLPQRQAMIEAWEVAEWGERDAEIRGVQEERLALLAQALQVREEEIEAAHRQQVQRRSGALMAAKVTKLAAIQAARIKAARQLADAKAMLTGQVDRRHKSAIIQQYANYGSPLYAPLQRDGHFPDATHAGAAPVSPGSRGGAAGALQAITFHPTSIAALNALEGSLPRRTLQPQLRAPDQPATRKLTYAQRTQAAVQQDVATIHDMLEAAKAVSGTRGVGRAWPCPLDDSAAAAAALAAAAAAAEAQKAGSRHAQRSGGCGVAGGAGGLSAAAAAAAAAGGRSGVGAGRSAHGIAGGGQPPHPPASAGAAAAACPTEAPPLPDADGRHAALVLLQRLLRGRAAQVQMHAGRQAHLQLVRELRLGLEGTGGRHGRPEQRDAATQELDAAVGGALCRLCCLLASDDEAAVAQVLAAVEHKQAQVHQHHQQRQQPQEDHCVQPQPPPPPQEQPPPNSAEDEQGRSRAESELEASAEAQQSGADVGASCAQAGAPAAECSADMPQATARPADAASLSAEEQPDDESSHDGVGQHS